MSDIALVHHRHHDLLGQRGFEGVPIPETRPTKRVDYRRPNSLQGAAALSTLAPLFPSGKRTSIVAPTPSTPRRSSIRCADLQGRHPDTTGLLGGTTMADTPVCWRRRPLTAPCLPAVHQALARALHNEQQAAYVYYQRRGRVSRVVLG